MSLWASTAYCRELALKDAKYELARTLLRSPLSPAGRSSSAAARAHPPSISPIFKWHKNVRGLLAHPYRALRFSDSVQTCYESQTVYTHRKIPHPWRAVARVGQMHLSL